jgi:hypothetical protein
MLTALDVRPTHVNLPDHIAERVRAVVAATSTEGGHVDCEAARHGGVALMGTIGATWLLRPDGSIWDVDDEFGRPIAPLPSEWHHAAIRCGAQRHPWLAELIPARPPAATDCPTCKGRDDFPVICPDCFFRGWKVAV